MINSLLLRPLLVHLSFIRCSVIVAFYQMKWSLVDIYKCNCIWTDIVVSTYKLLLIILVLAKLPHSTRHISSSLLFLLLESKYKKNTSLYIKWIQLFHARLIFNHIIQHCIEKVSNRYIKAAWPFYLSSAFSEPTLFSCDKKISTIFNLAVSIINRNILWTHLNLFKWHYIISVQMLNHLT